jgi:uncharacterized protein YbjQ (UPF0145 family)
VDPELLRLGFPLVLLVATFASGSLLERRHYVSIRTRERELASLPTLSFRRPPAHWEVRRADFVAGNVVVSIDYFKRFLAALRALVGGRVKSYESLLDRARREALLRMREAAREQGFHAVVNVRLETSRLASSGRDGKGTAGVEILAYGTGVELTHAP